jgi:hypothetical protein
MWNTQKIYLSKNKYILSFNQIMTTHRSFDNFPEEFHLLDIYKPESYQIYKTHSYFDKFIVKYDDFKFMICNGVFILYPSTFVISEKTIDEGSKSIILKDNPNDYQCPIANIYYKYPNEIMTDHAYINGELLDISLVIEQAKKVIGKKWHNELSFGIIIFYYWIQIYYQKQKEKIVPVYNMFETENLNVDRYVQHGDFLIRKRT